jgi:hypothetical protein
MATRWVLTALLTSAVALRLAFFAVSTTHLPPVDDEAHAMLLARQIREDWIIPLRVPGQPYEFPVESFLLAPIVTFLPSTAFGARLPFLVLGLLLLLGQLALYRRLAPLPAAWPGLLLVLFPSAAALTFQAAVAWPQYAALAAFTWLLLFLVVRLDAAPGRLLPCALAGFLSGLALSSHMLALSVVAAASLAICLSDGWRNAARSTLGYGVGVGLGLLPYVLATAAVGNSGDTVLGTRPAAEALSRWWMPTLSESVPGAMGIDLPPMTDFHQPQRLVPGLASVFGGLFLVILLVATAASAVRFAQRLRRTEWPTLTIHDVLVGAIWLCLILFTLSTRATSHSYRYLLPIVWLFPFLLGDLHARSRKAVRATLAAFALLLVGYNLVAAGLLMHQWTQPAFAATHADTPPLDAALRVLAQRGWRHCYAPFWLAHRIIFESRQQITCSQPYNERFVREPLPHKARVDAAPDVPYVLFDGASIRFTRSRFEQDLRTMGVSYELLLAGRFFIYHNFSYPRAASEWPLPQAAFDVTTSHNPFDAPRLRDGQLATWWNSNRMQEAGMWLELGFRRAETLSGVEVDYGQYPHDRATALRVLVHEPTGWRVVVARVPGRLDPFTFANGRPIYGGQLQTIRFSPVRVDALRIEIETPTPGRHWQVSEIRVNMPLGNLEFPLDTLAGLPRRSETGAHPE